MVERIVYFGPFNNSKKEELFEKSIDYLRNNKGDKFYYLLPNGGLLKSYRRRFIETLENSFEINVLTFDDIVNKVVKDSTKETITNPMKNALIKHSLINLSDKNKLEYFKNAIQMDGFVKSCNSIIGEIKRSLVSPDEYNVNCPDLVSFKEMGKIYLEYEKNLQEFNLSDRESDYLYCIDLLKYDNSFLEDLDMIIIDQFYDFRPIEMSILREIMKSKVSVYINVPFQTRERNKVVEETLEKLKDLGFKIQFVSKTDNNDFENLSSSLFTGKRQIIDPIESLELIKSYSIYLEYKKIFEEIKKHYLNGISLDDIGIVVTNNSYLEPLFKVALEEEIQLNKTKTISLMDIGLIREFLNIIENVLMGGSKTTLINRVKSIYFPIVEKGQGEGLEFIIRKQNYENIEELNNLLSSSKKLNFPLQYFNPLKDCIAITSDEIKNIPLISTIGNYKEIFLNLLKLYDIDNMILLKYKKTEDFMDFNKEIKVVEELRTIIMQTEELSVIQETITLEQYYESLIDYLSEKEIVDKRGNLNGVKIYEPVNARGFENEILFVVGLSQGNYPNLANNNYFMKDENGDLLKKLNIQYKDYENRLNNENLKFASTISTCRAKLYLSYSGNSQNDGLGIPSMFLDEVFTLLKGEKIEDKLKVTTIDLDYLIKEDINNITTNRDLTNYLLYNYFNGNTLDNEYFYIHNNYFKEKLSSVNLKLKSENGRVNNIFDIYRGKLDNENITSDIHTAIGDRSFSISYLESYSKCPFYFFMNNYFKIEEMERSYEDYSPMDIGSIYHLSLKWFYLEYSREIKKRVIEGTEFLNSHSKEHFKNFINKLFIEYGFDLQLNKNKVIVRNTYDKLIKFINEDMIRISDPKEKLLPYEFEKEFEDFNIHLDGHTIPMIGIIDRIDKLLYKDAYVVMDYKSSSYGSRNIDHMRNGLSLQLPVYIMSNKGKPVVAGLYGIINSAKVEVPIGILNGSNIISNRHKGALNIQQWDELLKITEKNILNNINGIKSGNFSVNPLECSPYCIYKDICRYEKILEVE